MEGMKFIEGDLLDCPQADLIAQQCNCLTVRGHGLSAAISARFPAADCYARRRPVGKRNLAVPEDRGKPGTAQIVDNKVVNLFGQWRPGKVNANYFDAYPEFPLRAETVDARAAWFRAALEDMARQLTKPKTLIAFPYQIGCGLAGGDWRRYLMILRDFEAAHKDRLEVMIVTLKKSVHVLEKRKRE